MPKPKVFVTRKWPESVEQRLQSQFDVRLNPNDIPPTTEELINALQNYDAVCPAVCDRLPAELLQTPNKRCQIIANYGVGFNHIDISTARSEGLIVTNTPGVLTDSTADIAMTLLLMSARRGAEGDRLVRAQQWQGWCPTHMMSSDVTGATLGLIGFGRIAQAMARKAHFGFGMKILFYKPSPTDPALYQPFNATPCDSLEQVLSQSDYVSLHCPGGASTRYLIDQKQLSQMKPSAHLINTARGDVINTEALIEALQKQYIAGAGLDVYENEPQVPEALLTLDNVTLLPHLGSATIATRTAMGNKVVDNLQAFFNHQPIPDQVV